VNNLSQSESKARQIEDIIDIEESTLSVDFIETIAHNEEVRKHNEKKYKGCLYSIILRSLTHKTFSEDEAFALWKEILNHMERLKILLGRNVGVAVASLDYLTNVKDKLTEPKIIEEEKSSFITETSAKDELTSLFTRGMFDAVLKKEIAEVARDKSSLSLLMIDIDDFKVINDTYGHSEGDKALKAIGSVINNLVREMDFAARYGGEELAIIMPGADNKSAFDVAERIRETIEEMQFDDFSVTVSIGVSTCRHNAVTAEELIKQADSALYRAKEKGKNQVQEYQNQNN
jgi:diguanylate cyclase (GGDEF)-like protein